MGGIIRGDVMTPTDVYTPEDKKDKEEESKTKKEEPKEPPQEKGFR